MGLAEEQQRRATINSMEDAKIEKHFRSQREIPNGRNFMFFNHEKDIVADNKYRDNYAATFGHK